jgi:hypothetical protein
MILKDGENSLMNKMKEIEKEMKSSEEDTR